jgi:hypothetical protein
MNTVLNENWREVVQELAPAIGDALSQLVQRVLTNISELLPFDEVFPETV